MQKKPIIIEIDKPIGIDLWLVSKEDGWRLKLFDERAFLYFNFNKKQLKRISQLIYDQSGIKPRLSK